MIHETVEAHLTRKQKLRRSQLFRYTKFRTQAWIWGFCALVMLSIAAFPNFVQSFPTMLASNSPSGRHLLATSNTTNKCEFKNEQHREAFLPHPSFSLQDRKDGAVALEILGTVAVCSLRFSEFSVHLDRCLFLCLRVLLFAQVCSTCLSVLQWFAMSTLRTP